MSSPTKSSLSNCYDQVGAGYPINFMVVEKSAVIKFDKHVASCMFSPDELENLDSYMMKYCSTASWSCSTTSSPTCA